MCETAEEPIPFPNLKIYTGLSARDVKCDANLFK